MGHEEHISCHPNKRTDQTADDGSDVSRLTQEVDETRSLVPAFVILSLTDCLSLEPNGQMDRLLNQTFRISTSSSPGPHVVGDFKFLLPNYETGNLVVGSSSRSVTRTSYLCREMNILFLDQPLTPDSRLFLKLEHKSNSPTTGFGLLIGLTSCSSRSIQTNECHAVARCHPDNSCAGRSIVVRIACPLIPDVLKIERQEDKFLVSSASDSHIRTEPAPVFQKKLQTMARFAEKFTSIPFLVLSGDVTAVRIVDATHFAPASQPAPLVPQSASSTGPSVESMIAASVIQISRALETFRQANTATPRPDVATPPSTPNPITGPAAPAPVVPVTRSQPPVRGNRHQRQQQRQNQWSPSSQSHQSQTRPRVQAPDRAMTFQSVTQTVPFARSAGSSRGRQRSVFYQNRTQTQRRTGHSVATAAPAVVAQVASAAPVAATTSQSVSEDAECVVCMDKKKVVMCWPCKHVCLCEECATRLNPAAGDSGCCPVCRATVRELVRVYL